MATKLTLYIEENLLLRVKSYAKKTGKSLTQIVEDYFALLMQEDKAPTHFHAPITESLRGILRRRVKISKSSYKRYLDNKYM